MSFADRSHHELQVCMIWAIWELSADQQMVCTEVTIYLSGYNGWGLAPCINVNGTQHITMNSSPSDISSAGIQTQHHKTDLSLCLTTPLMLQRWA